MGTREPIRVVPGMSKRACPGGGCGKDGPPGERPLHLLPRDQAWVPHQQPPPPFGMKAGAEDRLVFVPCIFVIGSWRPGKEPTEASGAEAPPEMWTPGMGLYIETTGYRCPGQSFC